MTDESSFSQRAQGNYIAQATHGGTATVQVVLPPTPMQEQNRVRFLRRLRYYYDELWEQSLQGAALLTLGLVEKPDAVLHTRLLLFSPRQTEHPLPPGTSIAQVYDASGQELLILGEPGAGKSTLLLDLARQLVERAVQDAGHPLPILLPLSSWAEKKPTLIEWLIDQLSLLYDVPRQVCRVWVHTNQIFPLLDGLDEVQQGARRACIDAITVYRKEHLVPLVVCSRRAEYEELAQQQRLVLHSAVVVQPLTKQQVDTYLDRAGQSLAAVRTVLRTSSVLQELTTTPLMLSVLTLAYTGAQEQDLPRQGSSDVQQQQIFTSYVERMVERKGNVVRYPLQRTQAWLGWLARQMRDHDQAVFYLEYLQPDWLPVGREQVYTWLAIQLPSILIGVLAGFTAATFFSPLGGVGVGYLLQNGILGGFLGGLLSEVGNKETPLRRLQSRPPHKPPLLNLARTVMSILIGLAYGLSFGLVFVFYPDLYSLRDWLRDGSIYGVAVGISCWWLMYLVPYLSSLRTQATPTQTVRCWPVFRRLVNILHEQRVLLIGVGVGGIIALSVGLSDALSYAADPHGIRGVSEVISYWLGSSLGLWPMYGFVSVLLSLILVARTKGIQLTDRLSLSWRSLLRSLFMRPHLRTTLLVASVFAAMTGLGAGVGSSFLVFALTNGLTNGLNVGLSYWLVLGLFQGVRSERIEDQDRRVPNQGTHRSVLNSLLMGVISGVLIWMIYGLSHRLIFILSVWLDGGFEGGLISQLTFGLSDRLTEWLNTSLTISSAWGASGPLNFGLSDWLDSCPLIICCSGLVICAISGGLAALQHYVIRFLLSRKRTFPWNAPQFLDDATARILLRRIGGGYRFVHRLILDTFASWDT